uniref:Secreted protein n=1 Tax=Ciona intestinalis TaxID=7719 RepID=H2XY96_CIOIN
MCTMWRSYGRPTTRSVWIMNLLTVCHCHCCCATSTISTTGMRAIWTCRCWRRYMTSAITRDAITRTSLHDASTSHVVPKCGWASLFCVDPC